MKSMLGIVIGFFIALAPALASAQIIPIPILTCPPLCNTPVTVTANAVIVTATENTATSSSFVATASNGSALTYEMLSSPANGSVNVSGSSFTYTPNNTFTGQDEFTYDAGNGTATSGPATVSITVSAPPADTTAPIITPPADQSFATSTFPAQPTLSPATATDDSGATPTISYSPTSFGVGTTTVTWTATDAAGNTATTTSQVAVYLSVNVSVDVPSSCTVTDSDGVQHSYNATSSTAYIGICAVQAAIDQGAVNAIFSNAFPTLGLFVTTLNTVAADPSSQFWALYQNGGFASLGLSALPVSTGDTLKLELHDFSDNPQGDQLSVTITSLVASSTLSASSTPAVIVQGGGGGGFSHLTFSVPNAIGFLTSKQGANGSFADDRLTDWAALAYAVADQSTAKQLLTNYLTASNPLLVTLTDYERHAMALEALGINPYTGTTIDTITPIVSAFDGTKLSSLVNINIFALFPLLHAGYSASDTMIQKIVAYILSQQSADGSWSDPDTTSAAIQALAPLNSLPGVNDALAKGRTFLRSIQNSNGSIGGQNLEFQTAWALQAIAALGENQLNWTAPSYDPLDYLASIQQTDGGVDSVTVDASTRVWATEYAIPAAAGKPWGTLLMNFSKPANAVPGTTSTTASTTVATSTAPTATSTPIIASSTPAVATTTTVSAPAAPTPETAPLISAPPTTPQAPQPPVAATPVAPTPDDAITAANTQLAAAGVIGIDYGSWWFLLLLILLAIFLAVLGWSLTNAWQNRRRS